MKLCSYIRRLNIFKKSVLPDLVFRFNTTPIKMPTRYFEDINKSYLNEEAKRPKRAYLILKEKNKIHRLTLPDFNIYYQNTVIKRAW